MTEKVTATEKENEVAVYLFHQGTNFRAYESSRKRQDGFQNMGSESRRDRPRFGFHGLGKRHTF